MTAKAAYVAAGFKSRGKAAETNAVRLMKKPAVAAAIEAANARAAKQHGITADWVTEKLVAEATRMGKGGTHAGRIRALELFKDQVEVSGPGGHPIEVREIVVSTQEEAVAILALEKARAGA
jgi:hypothetical protein